MHVTAKLTVGRLCPERKQEVREAPIDEVRAGGAVSAVLRAPGRVDDMVLGGPNRHRMPERLVIRYVVRIDVASVQEAEMRSIDLALERLQVIAVALDEAHSDLLLRHIEDFEPWQLRDPCMWPHINPDEPGALHGLIGLRFYLVLEILVWRHARHVDAVTRDVEFPPVIDAADPAFLVAAEEQRSAAVRAAMVHHADPARAVAK